MNTLACCKLRDKFETLQEYISLALTFVALTNSAINLKKENH